MTKRIEAEKLKQLLNQLQIKKIKKCLFTKRIPNPPEGKPPFRKVPALSLPKGRDRGILLPFIA
jgi:hypothetical protein